MVQTYRGVRWAYPTLTKLEAGNFQESRHYHHDDVRQRAHHRRDRNHVRLFFFRPFDHISDITVAKPLAVHTPT